MIYKILILKVIKIAKGSRTGNWNACATFIVLKQSVL